MWRLTFESIYSQYVGCKSYCIRIFFADLHVTFKSLLAVAITCDGDNNTKMVMKEPPPFSTCFKGIGVNTCLLDAPAWLPPPPFLTFSIARAHFHLTISVCCEELLYMTNAWKVRTILPACLPEHLRCPCGKRLVSTLWHPCFFFYLFLFIYL